MKSIKLFCLLLITCLVISCAKNDDEFGQVKEFKGMSAKELYLDGKKELSRNQYESAIKRFEALDIMYPFNDYARQAQLDLIYSYYQNQNYASAAASAERFIKLYPRYKHVDYVYYMKGLANFQQPRGTLTKLLNIDESQRDPGTQNQAYADFGTLIQRFPNTQYKANALQRMIYLRNQFAQRELNVANYYFKRRMYVAAAERANYLIETYPQAPSVQSALILSYKANKALGLHDAAEERAQVYTATYQQTMPGVDRATDQA